MAIKEHELKLDSRNRFRVKQCPCGKDNRDGKFVPYQEYDAYGYCHSCDQTFLPETKQQETDKPYQQQAKPNPFRKPRTEQRSFKESQQPDLIPENILKASLEPKKTIQQRAQGNSFLKFLLDQFGPDAAERLADFYLIGTAKAYKGSPIFWQIDHHHETRSGKVIQYNSNTGKRCDAMNWVHHLHPEIDGNSFTLKQCLFGSHLIPDSSGPFGIVEAEKTAVIASLYLPHITWLAAGNKTGLSAEKLNPLGKAEIILFPDADAQQEWQKKADELSSQFPGLTVSDMVYQAAQNRNLDKGTDLADILLNEPIPEPEQESVQQLAHDEPNETPSSPAEPIQQPCESEYKETESSYLEPVSPKARQYERDRMAAKNPKLYEASERLGLTI